MNIYNKYDCSKKTKEKRRLDFFKHLPNLNIQFTNTFSFLRSNSMKKILQVSLISLRSKIVSDN